MKGGAGCRKRQLGVACGNVHDRGWYKLFVAQRGRMVRSRKAARVFTTFVVSKSERVVR